MYGVGKYAWEVGMVWYGGKEVSLPDKYTHVISF